MTEKEWLTNSDPRAMLALLSHSPNERRLRFFHAKCCRRIWHLISDERSQRAVEIAERVAAGKANNEELVEALHSARRAVCEAKYAEWVAEAEADFEVTAEYCMYSVKLYASCAAMAAVSEKASNAHGGWEYYQSPELPDPLDWNDPPRGSQYWAAAAVGQLRQQQVLESGQLDDSIPIFTVDRTDWLEDQMISSQKSWATYLLELNARLAGEAFEKAESAKQADLLRELFGYPVQK